MYDGRSFLKRVGLFEYSELRSLEWSTVAEIGKQVLL